VRARKAERKNRKEIKAMRCLKWKSKQKGVAKIGGVATIDRKPQSAN